MSTDSGGGDFVEDDWDNEESSEEWEADVRTAEEMRSGRLAAELVAAEWGEPPILWWNRTEERAWEVRIDERPENPWGLGPVHVRRFPSIRPGNEATGTAANLEEAMERWPELREMGDNVTCRYWGDVEPLKEYLRSHLVLADGWSGAWIGDGPQSGFCPEVNYEPIGVTIEELDWTPVASVSTSAQCVDISLRDGWLRATSESREDLYSCAPFGAWVVPWGLEGERSGTLVVATNDLGLSELADFVNRLASSELVDEFEAIEVNGSHITERSTRT